jgi:tRNA pseudouridine38-40 synthase
MARELSRETLDVQAGCVLGSHCFRAFAVRGTAPVSDDDRCDIALAAWHDRPGGLVFEIEANRFLHHMVRFLMGTMIDAASGRRDPDSVRRLLDAPDNSGTSAPAPAHALFLERVTYPHDLYLMPA